MHCRRFAFALAGAALWATAGAAAETVDIPQGSPQGALTLHAMLYRPQGPGPFPAVLALHDCAGLDNQPAANAELYREWSTLLTTKGFVVIFPNSFGSRGFGAQCRLRQPKVRASRERVADVDATRRWLQTQTFVRPDRISLLGWASGGTAALWAVRPNAAPRDGGVDFRSVVALYPGCGRLRQTAWSARVPTLILIGGADETALASTCKQMVAGAHGRSARAEVVVYPGAGHEFDRTGNPARPRPEPADPSGRAQRGGNPAARTDALRRIPLWLAR